MPPSPLPPHPSQQRKRTGEIVEIPSTDSDEDFIEAARSIKVEDAKEKKKKKEEARNTATAVRNRAIASVAHELNPYYMAAFGPTKVTIYI